MANMMGLAIEALLAINAGRIVTNGVMVCWYAGVLASFDDPKPFADWGVTLWALIPCWRYISLCRQLYSWFHLTDGRDHFL